MGIKCSPNEAIRESRLDAVIENSGNGKCFRRFGTRKREKYELGDIVRICKRDNTNDKDKKDRSLEICNVVGSDDSKSVIVRKEGGKVVKKSIRVVKEVIN